MRASLSGFTFLADSEAVMTASSAAAVDGISGRTESYTGVSGVGPSTYTIDKDPMMITMIQTSFFM
jgi:hypothetical protein